TIVEPLGVDEAVDYVQHHLRACGGEPTKIIDESALEVLARGAKGVPRLLNQAAHQALLLADAGDLDSVDAEAALEALAILGLEAEESNNLENATTADADEEQAFSLSGARRLTA